MVKEINVSETKIGTILDEINPEAQIKKQPVASYQLNPKVYSTKYFDDKILYDQNKKLGMFGAAHACDRDGLSGKIVGRAIECNVSIFLRVRVLQKIIEMIPLKYS